MAKGLKQVCTIYVENQKQTHNSLPLMKKIERDVKQKISVPIKSTGVKN